MGSCRRKSAGSCRCLTRRGDTMAWQDVVFQYDGSFDGFLCCVFESYVHKEFPIAFYSDEECFSLYSVRSILTVPEYARRVYRGIFKRSKRAAELLQVQRYPG